MEPVADPHNIMVRPGYNLKTILNQTEGKRAFAIESN